MAPKRIEKPPIASTSSKSTKPRPEISKKKKSNAEVETETRKSSRSKQSEKLKDGKSTPTVSNPIACGREIVSFLKAEHSVNSLRLDESTMIANWDSIPDDPKKREMEAMFNKLYAMKLQLCAYRIGFVTQVAKTICKPDYASSSQNVPVLSQDDTVVGVNSENEENDIVNDVNKANEDNDIVNDVIKETCVASGSGIQNGQVCSVALEEEEDTCVELLESTEREIEQVSRKHIDPEESQEIEMEENQADMVSCDAANRESNNDASVTVAEEVKEDCRKQINPKESQEIEMEKNEADLVSCDAANVEINNDTSVAVAEEVKEDSRQHIDPKESQEIEMEENEADLVSCDAANIETNNDAFVTVAEEVKEDSRKHIDPNESQEIEMEENEADLVSCYASNIESINDASVTVAEEVKEDSCVVFGGIEEGSGSNPSSVSRKKLLVLDLNGLLANVVSAFPGCKGDKVIGKRAVFKRPFCDDFLKFCFEKFEVGVWSSRMQHNVERITEFLLGDMKSKLLFCWDMSYCVETRIGSLENIHKSVVFKELNQLWENRDSKLPWKKGDYNETNTVLIDDSPYKALLNPPYTAIFPHSYNHQNKTDASLGSNGDLRLHLEKLAEAENVQEFIKKNPFGQEAITEASESWEFYRGAIAQSRHLQKKYY